MTPIPERSPAQSHGSRYRCISHQGRAHNSLLGMFNGRAYSRARRLFSSASPVHFSVQSTLCIWCAVSIYFNLGRHDCLQTHASGAGGYSRFSYTGYYPVPCLEPYISTPNHRRLNNYFAVRVHWPHCLQAACFFPRILHAPVPFLPI